MVFRISRIHRRFIPLVAVLAILGALFVYTNPENGYAGYIFGSVIVVALVTLLVDAHFKSQMRTAVEATNANMSYDSEGLVITERWRSKFYMRKSKARSQLDAS